MGATSYYVNHVLDYLQCQVSSIPVVRQLCLWNATANTLGDCSDVAPENKTVDYVSPDSYRVFAYASVTATGNYTVNQVVVRSLVAPDRYEIIFVTPLDAPVDVISGVSYSVGWQVVISVNVTYSGFFNVHSYGEVARVVAYETYGQPVGKCFGKIVYGVTDEATGVFYHLLMTSFTHDTVNRRSYHPRTNFGTSGGLREYYICHSNIVYPIDCVSASIANGATTDSRLVSASDSIEFTVNFSF